MHKATWKLPPYENTPEYWEQHKAWRKDYNTCAECGSTKVSVKNYDEIWMDGDVICENGHYVRGYNAG